MNSPLSPRRILKRKLDPLISKSPFFFQNIGYRGLCSNFFFFSIKKADYTDIELNLVLDDELFAKYFHKNLNLKTNSHNLSYFIKESGSKYPSVCNLKYFGKEVLLCKNLQLNKPINKVIYSKEQIKKINYREFFLKIKELTTVSNTLLIFSTLLNYQRFDFKNSFTNDEFVFIDFVFEDINLINTTKKICKIKKKDNGNHLLSVILTEFYQSCLIGIYRKINKYWFECSSRNKIMYSNNIFIAERLKRIFSPTKILSKNFIYSTNWSDDKSRFYFSKLKTTLDWVTKDINQGLKENDLRSNNPISLDDFVFLPRRPHELSSNPSNISLNVKFENFESQFFNFSSRFIFKKNLKRWKEATICLEKDFNKLLYKINNSSFLYNETNSTQGIDCSWNNNLIFSGHNFQKVFNNLIQSPLNLKISQSQVYGIFNFKTYNFSLGRSTNYSKF